MSSKLKWWLNGIGAVIFVVVAVVYLIVRPIVVQNLEPVIQKAVAEKVNGSLAWRSMDLDPQYNLSFDYVELKDGSDEGVLKSPNITIDWSLSGLYAYMMNNGNIVDVVRGVTVEEPELTVREKTDGSWNVQNLLKPAKDDTTGDFKGKVFLNKGNVKVEFNTGDTYQFHAIDGKFAWQDDKKIKGTIDGTFLETPFKGDLLYTNENNFEGNVQTESVPLNSLKPLINKMPDTMHSFEVKAGTGEVTSAKIWRSDGALSYHVKGRLDQAEMSYTQYALTDGAAFFDIYDGVLQVQNFSGKINGQKITGNMNVNWKEESPALDGDVKFSQIEIEEVLPDEGLKGTVTGSGYISGTVAAPSCVGTIFVKDGAYQDVAVKDGEASFSYRNNGIEVSSLQAHTASGFITGHGKLDVGNGGFNGEVVAEDIDLSQLPTGYDLSGTVTGSAIVNGSYTDGSMVLYDATVEGNGKNISYNGNESGVISGEGVYENGGWTASFVGSDLNIQGISADSVAGKIRKEGGTYTISYLNGSDKESAFSVHGIYSDSYISLNATGTNVDISKFSQISDVDMAGKASFDMKIGGSSAAPSLEGNIHARNGHLQTARFDSIDGYITSADNQLNVNSILWKYNSGVHKVSGYVGLEQQHSLELHVESSNIRIENLLSMASLSYPVTGWIENKMDITGTMDNPRVTGDFLAWDGSVSDQLFQSASGEYSYADGKASIKNGLAYIYDGTAYLQGSVDKDNLDLKLSMIDVEIGKVVPDKGATGKVALNGHVFGTTGNPSFEGTIQSRRIDVGDGHLGMISAGINYGDHVLSIVDGSFRQGTGDFKWKGVYNDNLGTVSGDLGFQNWDVGEVVKFFKLPVSNVSGTVDGGMSISGTLEDPNVSFRAKVNEGHLADTIIGQGDIDFSYINHALSIRKLYIPVGKGILAAEGGMSAEGDLNLKFAANGMDIAWIPKILGKDNIHLGGELTTAVDLTGTKSDPVIDFSVGVEHPSYNDYSFDSMALMGNTENGVIHISQALVKREPYKVSAKGSMPINVITRIPSENATPLNLDLNLDNADLNALALFFKPVSSAEGPIKGQIKVRGSWDDPELFGDIAVKNGHMTLMTLSNPVSPLDMDVHLTGKNADVDGSAVFGDGKASMKGQLSWDNCAITGYKGEAHLHAKNIHSDYYKGAIDADFNLGEVMGQPGIDGIVNVHDAVIDVPLSLLSESSGSDIPALMKTEIIVGDKVRLYNSSLYDLWLRGNIEAVGPVSSPMVNGRIDVEKGTVKVNTTEFKIDTGNAVWSGNQETILPDVHVRASTKVGHYNIRAEMDGLPGNMKTVFHSEPYLNDSQILMLLTLHANPNGENSGAIEGALFNAGLTMVLGNGVQDFFKDTIGLDLISITSSLTDYYDSTSANNDNYYYIKIGKYLFSDFMLTATTGVNNSQKSVGFHYDINSHVGLSSWYNSQHESYIGTDWKFKF